VVPRAELLATVQRPRMFPMEDVLQELARLVHSKSDVLFDQYGRRGFLTQTGAEYAFQPVELTDMQSTGTFERTVPVEQKPASVPLKGGSRPPPVSISLCVEVATGDSNVTLRDPWYRTVREWFNELQLVHRITPEQVRQIVMDHAIMDRKNPRISNSPGKGWLDETGALHLSLGGKSRLASTLSKAELLLLMDEGDPPLCKSSLFQKRRVTQQQLLVLAEVLLRHRQNMHPEEPWFGLKTISK